MAEPSTSTVAVAMASGVSLGAMSAINPEAAVGALCGSLLYFSFAREVPMAWRLIYFLISFVMGYLCAPAMAQAELFGFGPIDFPGPAAFIASALVVTITLAAMRGKSQGSPTGV
ncbi:putative phage holin [compost metagenome]